MINLLFHISLVAFAATADRLTSYSVQPPTSDTLVSYKPPIVSNNQRGKDNYPNRQHLLSPL